MSMIMADGAGGWCASDLLRSIAEATPVSASLAAATERTPVPSYAVPSDRGPDSSDAPTVRRPSTPPPAPLVASWFKLRSGDWGVRVAGPNAAAASGEVEVTKRNGASQSVTLGVLVWGAPRVGVTSDVAIFAIAGRARRAPPAAARPAARRAAPRRAPPAAPPAARCACSNGQWCAACL